jgi:RecA-family ATPase
MTESTKDNGASDRSVITPTTEVAHVVGNVDCTTDFLQVISFAKKDSRASKIMTVSEGVFTVAKDRDNFFDNYHRRVGISNLSQLAEALKGLAPQDYLVPGEVPTNLNDRKIRRLSGAKHDPEDLTIVPSAHHWVAFDVDKTLELSVEDWVKAALPAEFHNSDYVIQYSSSHNPGKVLKAHVFFWLERKLSTDQIRATFSQYADESIYRTGQPLYVTKPKFVDESGVEVPDPLKERVVLVTKGARSVRFDQIIEPSEFERHGVILKDPRTISGPVGDFHRQYSLEQVVGELIPGEFEFDRNSDSRLTWLKSDSGSKGGAFVTDDRMHIGASHNSWPFGYNKAANLWDLVREFKFGHLDSNDDRILAPQKRPSHFEMVSTYAVKSSAAEDFAGLDVEVPVSKIEKLDLKSLIDKVKAQGLSSITTIKQPEFYVDGLIAKGLSGGLVSKGGTGKTTLLIQLAVATALGGNWLGRKVETGSFVLLSLDDTQENLLGALARHIEEVGYSKEEVDVIFDKVTLLSLTGVDSSLSFAAETRDGTVSTGLELRIIEGLSHIDDIQCVAIDTMRQFAGGSTNDDRLVTVATKAVGKIAETLRCAAIVCAHGTKAGAREGVSDQYAGAGSGAFGDNLRFILTLQQVAVKDVLSELNVNPDDWFNYGLVEGSKDTFLRLDDTRGSLLRRTLPATFIRRKEYSFDHIEAERKTFEQKSEAKCNQLEKDVISYLDDHGAIESKALHTLLRKSKQPVSQAVEALVSRRVVLKTTIDTGKAGVKPTQLSLDPNWRDIYNFDKSEPLEDILA